MDRNTGTIINFNTMSILKVPFAKFNFKLSNISQKIKFFLFVSYKVWDQSEFQEQYIFFVPLEQIQGKILNDP